MGCQINTRCRFVWSRSLTLVTNSHHSISSNMANTRWLTRDIYRYVEAGDRPKSLRAWDSSSTGIKRCLSFALPSSRFISPQVLKHDDLLCPYHTGLTAFDKSCQTTTDLSPGFAAITITKENAAVATRHIVTTIWTPSMTMRPTGIQHTKGPYGFLATATCVPTPRICMPIGTFIRQCKALGHATEKFAI